MPPSNKGEIRRELAEQGLDPDDVFGRWLVEVLAHGEVAAHGTTSDAPVRRRPEAQKKGRSARPTRTGSRSNNPEG
jgi:hypothetical protein